MGVVAGGLVWAFGYNSNEPGLFDVPTGAQLVTAQPVPTQTLAVAPPSTAQARGTEVASIERTVISDEREVSAATILDNTTAGDSPGRPAEALAHALEGPARRDEKDELTAAFDRPTAPAKGGHATKPHDKGGAKDKHKADSARAAHATHGAHAAHPAKKRTGHGAASAADSDVALLEALISHSRPSGKAGAAKIPVRAARCAPVDGDDEHGAHRSAECKSLPVVKAAG